MALLAAMVAVASVFAMFACLVALYKRGQARKPGYYKSASHNSAAGAKSTGSSFADKMSSLHAGHGSGATHRTVVLYGSQTGTSEGFAKELVEQINARFPKSTVALRVDLEELTPEVCRTQCTIT